MSVIERNLWTWRRKDNGRVGTCTDREHAEVLREHGGYEIEEYVPAEQLQGAVSARDELIDGIRMAAAALEQAGYKQSAASARATADKYGRQSPRPARTSRTQARSVECPHCGAGPGEACIGARGKPRASMHRERHDAIEGP